jgi:hypothetical protein
MTVLCRAVSNPNVTIRNMLHRCGVPGPASHERHVVREGAAGEQVHVRPAAARQLRPGDGGGALAVHVQGLPQEVVLEIRAERAAVAAHWRRRWETQSGRHGERRGEGGSRPLEAAVGDAVREAR